MDSDNSHSPSVARKSSAATLLGAFRNLTTKSPPVAPSTSPIPSIPPVSSASSDRDTLWTNHITASSDYRTSWHDSGRQSISANENIELLVGASAELNTLFLKMKSAKSISTKLSVATSMADLLEHQKVKDSLPIWIAANDLLKDNHLEARTAALKLLLRCCTASELSATDKSIYWESLSNYRYSDNLSTRIEIFKALTSNGRTIELLQDDPSKLLAKFLREAYRSAAGVRKKNKTSKVHVSNASETDLSTLFEFITDIIRFNATVLDDDSLETVIVELVSVCKVTTSEDDLINATKVMAAIATYANFTHSIFHPCIYLLCQIYRQLDSLKDHCWDVFRFIFHSNLKNDVVNKCFDILRTTKFLDPKSTIIDDLAASHGALNVLRDLTLNNGMDGLPEIMLSSFSAAIHVAVQNIKNSSFILDILKYYECVLDDTNLRYRLIDDVDWFILCQTLEHAYAFLADKTSINSVLRKVQSDNSIQSNGSSNEAVRNGSPIRTFPAPSSSPVPLPSTSTSTAIASTSTTPDKYKIESNHVFSQIIDNLCIILDDINIIHQDEAIKLFFRLGEDLSNNGCKKLLSILSSRPALMPPAFGRIDQVWQHVAIFFAQDLNRPISIRTDAYRYLIDRFDIVKHYSMDELLDYTSLILQNLRMENDLAVIEILSSFMAQGLKSEYRDILFDEIMATARSAILEYRNNYPSNIKRPSVITMTEKPLQVSPHRIMVRHIIRAFLVVMNHSGHHADAMFHLIIDISGSHIIPADARICALKLLFRIRCTADYHVYIANTSESESIAGVVCRTTESALKASSEIEERREARNLSTGILTVGSLKSKLSTQNKVALVPPLWFYPGPQDLPQDPSKHASPVLKITTTNPDGFNDDTHSDTEDTNDDKHDDDIDDDNDNDDDDDNNKDILVNLPIQLWLEQVIWILQTPGIHWDIYSYVIVHLSGQLKNKTLFEGAKRQIALLRNILCDQLRSSTFQQPPTDTTLRKSDVAICLINSLTILVAYHDNFAQSELDNMIKIFTQGLTTWEGTAKWSIHALTVCCYETPKTLSKQLGDILQAMSRIITQPNIAVHILEFLCTLSRLPNVFVNFTEEDYKLVFAVSFKYLQWVQDQKRKGNRFPTTNLNVPAPKSKRLSDISKELNSNETELSTRNKSEEDLPQYVYALAYHVITFWFMALKLQSRPLMMTWIKKNLTYLDESGRDFVEDQAQVTFDMMDRIAWSDRDETKYIENFATIQDGDVQRTTWIAGISLLTIETAIRTGVSQIIRRRPSGTRYSIWRPNLTNLPHHQVPIGLQADSNVFYTPSYTGILPQDVLQEMYSSMNLQCIGNSTEAVEIPIELPKDDWVKRAITSFDRNHAVDGHKIGVIYIGDGQKKEKDILANTSGSLAYTEFTSQLGTLVRLREASFNTHGLDRSNDEDGKYTYCWRDRATEVVFHITTMMPTDFEGDANCTRKKRHVGNDFVNVIWNDSGEDFKFDTFPSDFNYVYIVITPEVQTGFVKQRFSTKSMSSTKAKLNGVDDVESKTKTEEIPVTSTLYYKVQLLSASGFPCISPAAETKFVSAKSLGPFVRLLAINASYFSLVWLNRDGGEHISSWRNRLREIRKLRDKYGKRK